MSGKVYDSLQAYVYQYRRYFNETRFSGQMSGRAEFLYPFGSQSIAKSLELLVTHSDSKSLKAKNPTLHTLRHSIATHLLQNGMDIERIASFLGHTTLESTKIYTHLANEPSR
jgi:integrase/recombinase XerD